MKPTYIVVGMAAFSTSSPDYDAMLANKDCAAAGKLTSADEEKATSKQQLGIASLLLKCNLGSILKP